MHNAQDHSYSVGQKTFFPEEGKLLIVDWIVKSFWHNNYQNWEVGAFIKIIETHSKASTTCFLPIPDLLAMSHIGKLLFEGKIEKGMTFIRSQDGATNVTIGSPENPFIVMVATKKHTMHAIMEAPVFLGFATYLSAAAIATEQSCFHIRKANDRSFAQPYVSRSQMEQSQGQGGYNPPNNNPQGQSGYNQQHNPQGQSGYNQQHNPQGQGGYSQPNNQTPNRGNQHQQNNQQNRGYADANYPTDSEEIPL